MPRHSNELAMRNSIRQAFATTHRLSWRCVVSARSRAWSARVASAVAPDECARRPRHHERPAVEDQVDRDERSDRPRPRYRPPDPHHDADEHHDGVAGHHIGSPRKPGRARRGESDDPGDREERRHDERQRRPAIPRCGPPHRRGRPLGAGADWSARLPPPTSQPRRSQRQLPLARRLHHGSTP